MQFNSHVYIIFLAVAVGLVLMSPKRARPLLLSVLSLFFYAMWRWEFTLLIIFTVAVNFLAARGIHVAADTRRRKLLLAAAIIVNLALLAFFKYVYFIYDNISLLTGGTLPASGDLAFTIILPLGISFYTFQAMSYTIDVYRGVAQPEPDPLMFLAYVTFWPQLIAGPILRADEVIPQIREPAPVDRTDIAYGVQRILTGMFKKVVIADNLSVLVDNLYGMSSGAVATLPGNDAFVLAALFGFQIYFDFAGYSDIAIGSARLIGMRFPENFNWPYLARTPKEFWNRWHISLSSWIRDYLYIPLTGAKFAHGSTGGMSVAADDRRRAWALFITWGIMGLWHGAAWTFVMWGLYHAAVVYVFRRLRFMDSLAEKMPPLGWAVTFFLTMSGWVFFRGQTESQALTLISRIFNPLTYGSPQIHPAVYLSFFALFIFMFAARIFCGAMNARSSQLRFSLATAATAILTAAGIIYLQTINQFIYFQF